MSPLPDDLQVVARDDAEADAGLVRDAEGRPLLLVLRTGQTFDNACAAVLRAAPDTHPSIVRALVRRALPTAPEMPVLDPAPPPPPQAPAPPLRSVHTLVAAGVATIVALMFVGAGVTAAPDPAPTAAAMQSPASQLAMVPAHEHPMELHVQGMATAVGLTCEMVGPTSANCTDFTSGRSMLVEGTESPASLILSVTSGDNKVIVRQERDTKAVQSWLATTANRRLFPSARGAGRWIVMGTDEELLDRWLPSLVKADQP